MFELGEALNGLLAALQDRNDRLCRTALHDDLTGLPNRRLFFELLARAMKRHQRHPHRFYAVLYMDLDQFNNINNGLGRPVGDQLLVAIGRRLTSCLRGADALSLAHPAEGIARLAGDEFTILMEDLQRPEDAEAIATRLLADLSSPFILGPHKVYCTASIGIATSRGAPENPEAMVRDANTALEEAKLAGRCRSVVFKESMRRRVEERLNTENDLRKAVEEGQFFLHYQPIVDLATGETVSLEALLRWQHPSRGLVSPAEFIPVAEETGLIVPIGEWVLREACRQLAAWWAAFGPGTPPAVSVNLSRRQLSQPGIVDAIVAILHETGVDPRAIHLEITESTVVRDVKATSELLARLKRIGVKIDLDDFGTGHSSLACLHEFRLDVLKIDRSFVTGLDQGRDVGVLIGAIVTLAKSLGISVIAEGVETPRQVDLLRALGCQCVQGYYFARPMPPADAMAFASRTAPAAK